MPNGSEWRNSNNKVLLTSYRSATPIPRILQALTGFGQASHASARREMAGNIEANLLIEINKIKLKDSMRNSPHRWHKLRAR
jgi:hypothetical protein